MAIRRPMIVPMTPPKMIRSEIFRMICSIWITMTAAIKPSKSPNNDNSHEFRYLYAIKYPLIEQARMSSERISNRIPPFLMIYLPGSSVTPERALSLLIKKAFTNPTGGSPVPQWRTEWDGNLRVSRNGDLKCLFSPGSAGFSHT
jgi:hypothetical protein